MLSSQARRYGQALVDRHALTREDVEALLDEASHSGASFDELLRRSGNVGEKDMAAGWAAAMGVTYVDFASEAVHPDAAGVLPADLVRAHRAVPVRLDGSTVVVAFAAPIDTDSIAAVSEHLAGGGHSVEIAAAASHEVDEAIAAVLGGPAPAVGASGPLPIDELYRLFDRVIQAGASDLHLAANQPPFMRVVGELIRMPDEPELSAARVRELVYSILSVRQQERFEAERELDTAHSMPGKVRFRVNVFVQRNAVGAAFRVIPFEVVPFDRLGLPDVVRNLATVPRGLVLVTGPTGSGKSSTLASMVDIVNSTRQCHIMTIEDPIEFVHRSKVALVNQREIGEDTGSFGAALKAALRQDPDVVLVGEMRDLETISTAITAAETGHLVFATLHTQDAAQTIDRIVDVFPGEQQGQVRIQLANSLQGVATQQLVPTIDGRGRAVACEVMLASTAVRALIRDGKVHQIHNAMATGKRQGMQTMDESLADLVRRGVVSADEALRRAHSPDELGRMIGRASGA